jgi:hypothetical protein
VKRSLQRSSIIDKLFIILNCPCGIDALGRYIPLGYVMPFDIGPVHARWNLTSFVSGVRKYHVTAQCGDISTMQEAILDEALAHPRVANPFCMKGSDRVILRP